MIEVTVLYHDKKEFKFGCDPDTTGEIEKIKNEEETAIELYNTIYSLISDEFPELEIDEDIIIELKEFDD
jgi:hypothetical protein